LTPVLRNIKNKFKKFFPGASPPNPSLSCPMKPHRTKNTLANLQGTG